MTHSEILDLIRRAYFGNITTVEPICGKIGHLTIALDRSLSNAIVISMSPRDGSWRIYITYQIETADNGWSPKFVIETYEQKGDPTDDLIWLRLRV